MSKAKAPGDDAAATVPRHDAVVVGAGFAGLHMLLMLRQLGMSALVIERASDVGGTWFWNRYPGARCDVPSLDYSVPWDSEADQSWDWSEVYATQPEILKYINHLAERHDFRRDIRFDTAVTQATWDADGSLWRIGTDRGDRVEARFFISAAGALSEPNLPDIPGIESFAGDVYHTGRWPGDIPFTGKRVAVIGTGSTGVQASTAIAREAEHLYVLQRTAQFSLPCLSPALTDEVRGARKAIYPAHREWQRNSFAATQFDLQLPFQMKAFDDPKETRFQNYEMCWNYGAAVLCGVYGDLSTDPAVATEVAEFVRGKIRGIVADPTVAESLCPPEGSFVGTRRIIIDTGYYQIFNQPNVTLVDLRRDPVTRITPTAIETRSASLPIDTLVIATGYDAVTGPLLAMNITGKDGVTLRDAWADGPQTYLGLMMAGFPNLFTITGPSSPGVLANVIFSIDQHVTWIADCLAHMRDTGAVEIDTTQAAQAEWQTHALETSAHDLRRKDESNNWYLGANIPGKPRSVLVYQGGLDHYKGRCDAIVADGYRGFVFQRQRETAAA